ncbi:hypothetical protein [Streptomyces aureus]|uniref:hypothetical protein n=1 Tax=Streptomyces aureus TaxID=193461 RepID=UPI00131CB10E|nr:hypothetical protein [Streptomyces aureus]
MTTSANEGRAQEELQAKQTNLAHQLNAERDAQLAPFVAALEELAGQVEQLEHKLTAFPAIEAIFQRRDQARVALKAAEEVVEALDNDVAAPLVAGAKPTDRSSWPSSGETPGWTMTSPSETPISPSTSAPGPGRRSEGAVLPRLQLRDALP